MAEHISPVHTDIDFDKSGKHFGVLHVPYSGDRSAYGQMQIPIVVITNGGGGTLFTSGALLDRLTHHVNILEMNGDSYRLNQSRGRQTPTAN